MPAAASAVAKHAPIGKPPPSAFASGITSGVVVAQLTQRLEERMRRGTHAAFALQRFDQDARGVRTDRLLDGVEVTERYLIEAIHRRPEAFEIFG
jgi:hypothetical protein